MHTYLFFFSINTFQEFIQRRDEKTFGCNSKKILQNVSLCSSSQRDNSLPCPSPFGHRTHGKKGMSSFSNEHLTLSIYFIKIWLLTGIMRKVQWNPAAIFSTLFKDEGRHGPFYSVNDRLCFIAS